MHYGDDLWWVCHPSIYPDPLSLAIPPWVGAMSIVDMVSAISRKKRRL